MVSFSEVMIGGIGLLTAIAAGYGAVEQARYRGAIDTGDGATSDETTAQGRATACERPVTPPLTDEEAVVVAFTVERESGTRAGRQRLQTSVDAAPFRHERATQTVEVDASGATHSDVVVSDANKTKVVARSPDDLSDHAREHIPEAQLPPEGKKRIYTQYVIPQGDVTVVGDPKSADGESSCSGVSQRVVADGGAFQVSDLPPEELHEQRSLGSIAFRAIVAVAGVALAALVFLT